MLERFREHLDSTGLIPPGARVLVGYSGGADSTCLLHLLNLLEIDLVAAHLHHGQRVEAEKESNLCEAFCKELDVPFIAGKADVPRLAKDLRIGLEEAGREARYGFFRQSAYQTGCALIATAHTLSDNVETVLLNIARGAGLAGLAGIPEKRENIVRPLMIFSRDETREYCQTHGFWHHDDPANEDLTFSRARVRHRIVPELRALNPAAEEAVARLSSMAGEEDRFLNSMAAAALEQCERPPNGVLNFLSKDVEARLDKRTASHLPPVLFKRAVRLVAGVLGASLSSDQTDRILIGVASEEKGSVTAEGGQVAIEWDATYIHGRQITPTIPFRSSLTLPGETVSEEFGWSLTAFERDFDGQAPRRAELETQMDAAKVKGPLHFRSPKSGDSMHPLGFSGSRKLSDLLAEAKLTKAARARLPIICDMVGPAWAPGVCLDSRVAPDDGTKRVLALRFGPSTEGAKA